MESGEANIGPEPFRRRITPPPLPKSAPLAYRPAPPGEGAWMVAASFANANHWHEANRILSRNGIAARMRPGEGDTVGFDLLVLETELEWARDLIQRQGVANRPAQFTHGFPIDDVHVPAPDESSYVRAIPVEVQGLSHEQRSKYTGLIIILWVLLVIVLFVTIVGAMMMSN